jgi:hypothetical protein
MEITTSPRAVPDYIAHIDNEQRRADAQQLLKLMQDATGAKPAMWGASIVGFGTVHYKYESGREGDTVAVGFSVRKTALALYGVVFYNDVPATMARLGTYERGKGCLYIKRLADVNLDILKDMIKKAYTTKIQA